LITVLSIPRSGTRFYLYFAKFVLGLDARYVHFFSENIGKLNDVLTSDDVIIYPVRAYADIRKSYGDSEEFIARLDNEFIPVRDLMLPQLVKTGAHFMDIEKGPETYYQFSELLSALNLRWTPEISRFVDNWEKIGSGYILDDKSEKVIVAMNSTGGMN